jgi:hypothetical protein
MVLRLLYHKFFAKRNLLIIKTFYYRRYFSAMASPGRCAYPRRPSLAAALFPLPD